MRTPIESTDRNHAPRARAAGFSLIELLVVIGIIVLLASLVLAVSGSVIRANEERATRNTLTVLDTATEEYERTLDRRIWMPIRKGLSRLRIGPATPFTIARMSRWRWRKRL